MLEYRLDDLGWLEFEQLIQTLLKVRLGMGIEAWGGRGDWGRDAYFEGQLRYPAKELESGPFLFQCKFVEGANAAGASADALVLAAVRKECGLVKTRLKIWKVAPTHLTLFTNAPADPILRTKIKAAFHGVLPSAEVIISDGEDVCAWLRSARDVVLGFPQLLSIRDLQTLLSEAVNSETITRSSAAIKKAQSYARAFVPTSAYREARAKLNEHFFVVLEGPPEMGKTTIGRIIALTQVCQGWDALECRRPQEVLSNFHATRKQVFVADDFFGRTEYQPERVSNWQDELAHIIPMLDQSHWLILTSRAHLLTMAKANLDIDGQNHRFPSLSEVVVNAAELSETEQARILYRHAKAADLSVEARSLIRKHAMVIAKNSHFTPERIRRLVYEVVPKLNESSNVEEQIKSALVNPTKQMSVSFKALPVEHRWLLYSLLEVDSLFLDADQVAERFDILCHAANHRPFEAVLDELSEAFIRKSSEVTLKDIDWIHPSCRDLAIDELSANRADREHFLSLCSTEGILLATSVGGGSKGLRELPLLNTKADWAIFEARAEILSVEDESLASSLWKNCEELKKLASTSGVLAKAADRITEFLRKRILPHAISNFAHDSRPFFDRKTFRKLCVVCNGVGIPIEVDLAESWQSCEEAVGDWANSADIFYDRRSTPAAVVDFIDIVQDFFPELYQTKQQSGELNNIVERIASCGEEETRTWYDFGKTTDPETEERAASYRELGETYKRFAKLPSLAGAVASTLHGAAAYFARESESIYENLPGEREPDEDRDYNSGDAENVDVNDIFRDL